MKPREFFLPIEKREIFPSDYVYSSSVEMFERIAVPFIEKSAYQALEARHKKLLGALNEAQDTICSEYCGTFHHAKCREVTKAIEADRNAEEN